ncbi:MAG: DUF502 domain-containing protein [Candidatus Latescibacter sp.]|nr:DUF502 domain-containing protein [Candidatus Latescibacter sp.]
MVNKEEKKKSRFHKLRNYFTTGLLILTPTAVTIWVLVILFRMFDGIFGKLYTRLFEYLGYSVTHIPGLGALTLVIFITLFGFFVRFYVGKKFFGLWEGLMHRIPLLNKIYIATRQLSDVFKDSSKMNLGKPVMVEYPRRGIFSIGWITNERTRHFSDKAGKKVLGVYLATAPNPTSGMLIYVPEDELIPLDITSEDVMKLIISAGFVGPDEATVPKIM